MTPSHLTAFFSFILISFLLFTACGESNALSHRRSQFLMGTLVEIFVIEKIRGAYLNYDSKSILGDSQTGKNYELN